MIDITATVKDDRFDSFCLCALSDKHSDLLRSFLVGADGSEILLVGGRCCEGHALCIVDDLRADVLVRAVNRKSGTLSGTGIIAGKTVRAVVELAGIKNIRAKSLRSNNPPNVVKATFEGLTSLRTAEEVAQIRGIDVEKVKG